MEHVSLRDHINNPKRLAALRRVALLDTPTEEAFDRLSRLAARYTRSPVALVSLVDAKRQFFKSCIGLPEPWRSRRETPLSHSICQHNTVSGVPLVIEDARTDPLFCENLAISELNVVAYLGIPLVSSDSCVLGSFCVIDSKPRAWARDEIETVKDLASAVMTEIELRAEIAQRKKIQVDRDKLATVYAALQEEISARKIAEEERLRLEQQVHQIQKMEAMGSLAGGVAHDFNNILAIIIGNTELALQDTPKSSSVRSCLDEVLIACSRARDLARQILTFSRRSQQNRVPLKLSAVIKETMKLLRASLPVTIEIKENIAVESDTVLADPTQIHQILLNLCTNSAHSMRDKGGILGVCLTSENISVESTTGLATLNSGQYLRLSISDTGHGMEKSVLERIFEPYFTTKESGEGTGMGLAVVHGIVKSYGGQISVESEPGHGSTFHIYFPKHDATIDADTVRLDTLAKGTEKIIFVDDEEAIVVAMSSMLKKLGYQVDYTTDCQECLSLVRGNAAEYDLIVTDMAMPNMTGVELAKEIKSIRSDMPIILCTGYNDAIDEKKAIELGIHSFSLKPLTIKELSDSIRKVLDETKFGT